MRVEARFFLVFVLGVTARAQEPGSFQASGFIRGDTNAGGFLGLDDVLTIAGHLYLGEPRDLLCEDAADANDDGRLDLGDALRLLFHLFAGDAPPDAPFPECAPDPTEDVLGCASYWICGTGMFRNSIAMRLLPVRAGSFDMGSPAGERGRREDELLHRVTISCDFYLSETEVTQGQYLDIMGVNPSRFNGQSGGSNYGTVLSRAVEWVTWHDAVEFCRKLSVKEGRRYRLPYEAEWEYACRAGTTTRFWFGDLLECPDEAVVCLEADPYMWTNDERNRSGEGLPVGGKKPNPWGFYDMHGHVEEWCQDWYGVYPEGPVVDPKGPLRGTRRVSRGPPDSLSDGVVYMRSARRRALSPGEFGHTLGLRVVLELPRCPYGGIYTD